MQSTNSEFSKKQLIFREMTLGALVYAVILGFFNDYTSLLYTESYSTTFLAALVLQVLTYLTLLLKKRIANLFKEKAGPWSKTGLILSVWLVLFLSKFVFLAVIDFVFGASVEISGFIGLMAIIITMTAVKQGIDYAYMKLA